VNDRLKRLADILTSPDNGRLTRTVTNRIWHRLMGRGIVHPVDSMGVEPFSADLLDVLANHLADNKYDLKAAIELIVSSRAYQSQTVPVTNDNEYVFRGPIAKRLTAEQFVDAVWRLTGTAPPKPAFDAGDRGKESVRAALVKSDPLMRSLGRPNREQVVTTRPEELSTLQALDLTNGKELAETLERGAANLQKILTPRDELVAWVYKSALCRWPTAAELETARDMDVPDLLWAVLMLPEFQLVR
jgi:hypothetical protein